VNTTKKVESLIKKPLKAGMTCTRTLKKKNTRKALKRKVATSKRTQTKRVAELVSRIKGAV